MIYIGILGLLFIINILDNRNSKLLNKYDEKLFYGIAFIITFLASFRSGIGYDFFAYQTKYNEIHTLKYGILKTGLEPGYYLLNKISFNFAMVIFISGILCVVLKLIVIKRYSEKKWLSLMAYFGLVYVMYDMGVIRQGIAISFFLISIEYVIKKDLKKFLLCIGIGALFHVTILFCLPLYFIGEIKLEIKVIIGISIACILISLIDLKMIVETLNGILPSFIENKLIHYLNESNGTLIMPIIKRIIYLTGFVIAYKVLKIDGIKERIFLNGFILSIIIMAIGSSIPTLGNRGSFYLDILQIFIFAIILKKLDKKIIKDLLVIVVLILSIDTMIEPIKHGNISNQPYTPYKSIFQDNI